MLLRQLITTEIYRIYYAYVRKQWHLSVYVYIKLSIVIIVLYSVVSSI